MQPLADSYVMIDGNRSVRYGESHQIRHEIQAQLIFCPPYQDAQPIACLAALEWPTRICLNELYCTTALRSTAADHIKSLCCIRCYLPGLPTHVKSVTSGHFLSSLLVCSTDRLSDGARVSNIALVSMGDPTIDQLYCTAALRFTI
jgi:hypothetical protein